MNKYFIPVRSIVFAYNQKCECKLPDPDDCLILVPFLDWTGDVKCSICNTPYALDEEAIILK